jgi:hypothetical protein
MRLTGTFFMGKPGVWGLAGGLGITVSKDGFGSYAAAVFANNWIVPGVAYSSSGPKPNEIVLFASKSFGGASFQSDDAFLGANVGYNKAGVGGINVGENGFVVTKSFVPPIFSDWARVGFGFGAANPAIWGQVGRTMDLHGSGLAAYTGCGYCFMP